MRKFLLKILGIEKFVEKVVSSQIYDALRKPKEKENAGSIFLPIFWHATPYRFADKSYEDRVDRLMTYLGLEENYLSEKRVIKKLPKKSKK